MIEGKRVLGLITARGGSKRLPRKNVIPLADKPLIVWTIEAALRSRFIDRLILSSEDEEIIRVAREAGCEVPFRRPPELAADDTPGVAPVLDALERVAVYDYVAVLQPTSPLRTTEDIDATIQRVVELEAASVVTVVRVTKPPEWMYTIDEGGRLQSRMNLIALPERRQNAAPTYSLNGAVYCAEVETLRRERELVMAGTVAHEMPPERSADVDTELDLLWCEFLLSQRMHIGADVRGED